MEFKNQNEWINKKKSRLSPIKTENKLMVAMMTDGSYACGEHSITCRETESLCCTLETNVMWMNYIQIKKK